jgi:hypothetical protein
LVKNLDGKLTDASYLTQPQASAISILFTTLFKGSLTASTGICFTQHLWFILRGNEIRLATIEKLFILRTNLLALGDLRSTWRAPLLVLMALLVWCLGFATIYPPGALIVTFEAHTFTQNHNMSVMNPPVPQNLDLAQNDSFPTLATYQSGDVLWTIGKEPPSRGFGYSYVTRSKALFNTNLFSGPRQSLSNVARSILINNQVFSSIASLGENSTYHLQFRGPQFRCTRVDHNVSVPIDGMVYNDGLVFESKWESESLRYSIAQHWLRDANETYYDVQSMKQLCEPVSMLYDIEVSFPRGLRKIEHSCSDAEPVQNKSRILGPNGESELTLPAEPQVLHDWNQMLIAALPIVNQWALLDAMGELLVGKYYDGSHYDRTEGCDGGPSWQRSCVVVALGGPKYEGPANSSSKFILHFHVYYD